MFKQTILLSALSICFGIGLTQVSYAAEPMKILVTGYGSIIDENIPGAKDEAIADALRGAIEQVMEPMVKGETISENNQLVEDNIFSKAIGYIHLYEIISSGITVDSHYFVTLNVLVDWKEIEDDLDAMGLLHNRLGKPRLMVLMNEFAPEFDSFGRIGLVENALIADFYKRGFEFVDISSEKDSTFADELKMARSGDSEVAVALGSEFGADLVIIGESELSIVEGTGPVRLTPGGQESGAIKSVRADIRLRAVKTDNGVVMTEVTASAVYPHRNPIVGATRAVGKASTRVSEELAYILQNRWKTEVNAGRSVLLKVQNVHDFNNFTRLKSSLGNFIDGFLDLSGRSYDGISAEFELIVRSTPEKMAAELNGKSFEDFDIKVMALTMNSLTISLTELNE